MRARFGQAEAEGWRWGAIILKPADPPAGYTANTVLTEWLTVRCAARWASHARRGWLEVRFEAEADYRAAQAHFLAAGLWQEL